MRVFSRRRLRLFRRHPGTISVYWSVVFLALTAGVQADDWPMLGHDAARTGASTSDIRPPFVRKWCRLFPDEGIQSGVQPIVAQGKVYLGTLAGILHSMDADSGKDIWTFKASGAILHAVAASSQRVFFGSADGNIYALNTVDGQPAWRFRTRSAIWNAPALHQNLVLIASRDGHLYALQADTGNLVWQADTGAPVLNSPAIDAKSKRVFVGSESMRVHAYDLADGHLLWTSEQLPGASMRGYHPVIAPDGSVLITTEPVMGYDRFQNLLLEMVRDVFGDFASWRHRPEENNRLRQDNFRLMEKPETYPAQLDYLRRRLTQEPGFQTFFVLDPQTGRQRFVAPIVASESMNGPGAPPVVTPEGRVIVKYQVLLRSRYEHYSPFLNVGYLDTATGQITPIMDQTRTYGWHDSLLLVHDEQCQLSVAGRLLINTHQDNVNAMDLDTLKGYAQPFAWNVHEPAAGEALAIQMEIQRGRELTPGNEWLMRGTAIYGGGSVLDVPVVIAGDSFYYVPSHEINSGCALIAYRSQPGAPELKRKVLSKPELTAQEWQRLQDLPWDWDTLGTPRLKNLLEALPGKVPGTLQAPLTAEAEKTVAAIPDTALEELIWKPAFDPALPMVLPSMPDSLLTSLRSVTRELISQPWKPLLMPAGKAPEEACRFFTDPSETIYSLMLARPCLDSDLQRKTDLYVSELITRLPRVYETAQGSNRTVYDVPLNYLRVSEEIVRDDLARLYPLWLWSRTPAGADFAGKNWSNLRSRLDTPPAKMEDDCGNGRLAGLIAYCRFAKTVKDQAALDTALPLTRKAMRDRLIYALSCTRGGVIRELLGRRAGFVRWRHLTPDVAGILAQYAAPVEKHLMSVYVDYHRPCWWLAYNVEQLMRNEVPFQLPSTPLEIFTARALILKEPGRQLAEYVDLPWCRADEYYLQKIALTLLNSMP
jgi:hypothetical protein